MSRSISSTASALVVGTARSYRTLGLTLISDYDPRRSQSPPYALPDPLAVVSSEPVPDAATWTKVRRPEMHQLSQTHVFGEWASGQGDGTTFALKLPITWPDRAAKPQISLPLLLPTPGGIMSPL